MVMLAMGILQSSLRASWAMLKKQCVFAAGQTDVLPSKTHGLHHPQMMRQAWL
jgi:hypothetical protein